MAIYEIKHPLVRHKIGLMRKKDISTKSFRELASEIATCLAYEATKDIETEVVDLDTWSGTTAVDRIRGKKINVVPILRAGLGMLRGVLDLVPGCRVSMIGLARNEETLRPDCYYHKSANQVEERLTLVVDPMLATGGSLIAALDIIKTGGCDQIKALCLVAAPEGIRKMLKAHPDVDLYVAAIDERLNERGYILPGLGDAGDKMFGTKQ